MKNRRRARVLALQLMYAWDMRTGDVVDAVFAPIVDDFLTDDQEDLILEEGQEAPAPKEPTAEDREAVSYARLLAATAADRSEEFDALIQKHAANWEVKRMAAVDRNILRLAIAELIISADDVPYKVVIDESVEIAKEYGSDESGRFVNGVVDAIHTDLTSK